MKGLPRFVTAGVFMMAASGAFATPPAPGKHFDCSDSPMGTTSCAIDDVGCVSQTKSDISSVTTVNTLNCGDGLSKAFSKAIAAVGKCHSKQVTLSFGASAPAG